MSKLDQIKAEAEKMLKAEVPKRPTVGELEAILRSEDSPPVEMLPSGEVRVREPHMARLILALVEVAEAARAESVTLLAVAGEIEDAADTDTAWDEVHYARLGLRAALAKLEELK